MSWVRLDDDFPNHPKLVSAGPIAALIQIRALCYASHHLTNGFIPEEIVPTLLVGLEDVAICLQRGELTATYEDANKVQWPIKMLSNGLWTRVGGRRKGYLIHDYLKYQPSKEDVLKARENNRIRVSAWRDRRPKSNAITNAVSNAVGNALVTPSPIPIPNYKSSKKNTRRAESPRQRPHGSDNGADALKQSSGPTKPTPDEWLETAARIALRMSGLSREEFDRQVQEARQPPPAVP